MQPHPVLAATAERAAHECGSGWVLDIRETSGFMKWFQFAVGCGLTSTISI